MTDGLLSVFTPSHDPRYLSECYRSLAAQTLDRWEWVVLLNGKAASWSPPDDERVKVTKATSRLRSVGGMKRAACERAEGEVLVELDHDDLLTADCLEQVAAAFAAHPEVALVYSDFAQIDERGQPNHDRFDVEMGWEYSRESIDGVGHDRCHALAPYPHNLGYIWYAPNHVRAFSHDHYLKAGGYDPDLAILDDHDLMIRLYLEAPFHHIDRCLYLQRVHPGSTQVNPKRNAEIQEGTVALYLARIEALALAWAKRARLSALRVRTPIWFGPEEEQRDYDEVLIHPDDPRLPYEDGSCGVLKLPDLLQRIPDRAKLFNEAHRALAHGGLIFSDTPSTDGRGAFQDPSHVAFYNQNSFMYLTQDLLRPTIPALTARLQISHVRTHYPSPTHEMIDIPYVNANLIAVKDGPRQGGPLFC